MTAIIYPTNVVVKMQPSVIKFRRTDPNAEFVTSQTLNFTLEIVIKNTALEPTQEIIQLEVKFKLYDSSYYTFENGNSETIINKKIELDALPSNLVELREPLKIMNATEFKNIHNSPYVYFEVEAAVKAENSPKAISLFPTKFELVNVIA